MTKAVMDRMLEVERVRDAFHAAVFTARNVDAAVGLITDDFTMQNFPGTDAVIGVDDTRAYLRDTLLPHLPADLAFRRVTRTGDRWRVAQEDLVTFTHDRELPWLLPGVSPTGARAEVLVMSMVTVHRRSVKRHHLLWDHAALVSQLGLAPALAGV